MKCIKQRDEFFKATLTICLLLLLQLLQSVQTNSALFECWMGRQIFKQPIIVLAASNWALSS